jgi:hypothetical protein
MAWFRGNLPAPTKGPNPSFDPAFNRLFNPLAHLPQYISIATATAEELVRRDFYKPPPLMSQTQAVFNTDDIISMHDTLINTPNGALVISQIITQRQEWLISKKSIISWTPPSSNVNMNNHVLYLRVTRIEPPNVITSTQPTQGPATPSVSNILFQKTEFAISLVDGQGTVVGNRLDIQDYALINRVSGTEKNGFLFWHTMLLGVRIPLKDFGLQNLSGVEGIQFDFGGNLTPQGAIFIANIAINETE